MYAQLGNNTPVSIQYNGSQIYTNIFAGWETVAVETVNGQNQVLWKNAAAGTSLIWNMDSNWNYLYAGSTFALNSAGALSQETNFGLDLNGDGFVGILPTITISPIDNSAGEVVAGQTQNLGQFALNRTGNVSAALTVGYTVSGTATNGTDYSPLSGTVTFAAGNSNAVININVIDDADFEGNETVVLNLVANSAYTLGATTSSTVTIADNDLPTITVVANDSVAGEMASGQAQNPGQFTFSRTGSTANALTVNFGLGGTAISGSDYSALPTSVTFAAGASTAVVNINVTDDAVVVEGSETVFLQLLANAAYTLGATTSATITIADNDVASITVTSPNGGNSLQRGQAVTIQWNDNIPDNVRVDLYKNNIFYRNITTSTPSNGSLSWTVPTDVLLGTDYKIRVAKIDGTLIDFSDNNFSIAGTPNVDLKGYSLVSGVTAAAGSIQTINYNVQNAGIDPSGSFRVSFYLSSDTIFTTGDRLLGSETINSLAGGGLNGNLSKSLTLPVAGDSFYSGDKTYYIGMIVDDLNAVAETNEGDNSGQRLGDDYAAVTVNGTVAPFVTVTSPNGGESLQAGSSYNVTWSDNISENVKVDLFKGGVFAQTIFSSTLSDGSESWIVPTNLVGGSDYQIKISSVNNASLTDLSNANFTVLPVPTSWVKRIASPSSDSLGGIAIDSNGNINVSGNGSTGVFLANFDVSGSNTWLEQSISGYTTGIITNGSNIYTSGYTDPIDPDGSISQYSGDRTLLWNQKLGNAASSDFATAVATDSGGNVYITGSTSGNLGSTNAGGSDAFVAKYDTSGTLLWTKQLGTTANDNANGISTDILGNVYITGSTNGSLGGTNAGGSDAFVAKYNTSGTLLWTKQLGTSAYDSTNGISTDSLGNVYITGRTSGNLGDTNSGGYDAFAVKYDATGTLIWNQHFGDIANDYGEDIAVDNSGNVYIAGTTDGAIIPSLPNQGGADVFLAKISQGIDGSNAVTVNSPNGGESLQSGSTYNITWSDNIAENVKVDLFKGGVFAQTIFSSILSDGSESWTVPTNLVAGSDYQIKVSSVSNKKVFDFGNSYFTVGSAPFVTVTSPNGGNSLQRGQAVTIQWNDNIPDNVRVDLYKNNIFYRNITTSTPSNGSLSWTVPTDVLLGTDYKIRVAKTDGTLIDFSDNNFSIAGTPNIDLKGYSLVSPVTAAAGSTQNINYNIQNVGIDPSGSFRVSFYLSADTIFTTGDRLLDSTTINSVAGGSFNGSLSRSVTLPTVGDSFYSGDKTYYIGMIVDDLNVVAETNEVNNSGQKAGDDYAAVTVNGTVAPFVTVTSPNGGESLKAGSTYNVTWSDNIGENVKVDLYKAGAFYQTIFSSTSSDGIESWTVASNLASGSDYQIKISSVNNSNLYDWGNNYFTVAPATVDLKLYWFYYNFNAANYLAADSYNGSVIAPVGTYVVNSTYNPNITFDPNSSTTEAGTYGSYLIYQEDDYNDSLTNEAGRVFIHAYVDRDNGAVANFVPYKYKNGVQPSGTNYLGSEYDHIEDTLVSDSYFGGDYYEADPNPTSIVFWNKYQEVGGVSGILQSATSGIYGTVSGAFRQDFQGGAIIKSNSGIFSVFGGIGAKYLSLGAEYSSLGVPTSGEYNLNGNVRQDFANGYILWNGSSATAYPIGNPDIDIRLDFTYSGFNQTQINILEQAAQNWERIITRDMVPNGVINIVVTQGTTMQNGSAWNGIWAETNFPYPIGTIATPNVRYNLQEYGYDNTRGIDYDTRMHFNSYQLPNFNTNPNLFVRLAMHELGHALYLDEAQYDSLLGLDGVMDLSGLDPNITSGIYQRLEYLGYGVDRNASVYWS